MLNLERTHVSLKRSSKIENAETKTNNKAQVCKHCSPSLKNSYQTNNGCEHSNVVWRRFPWKFLELQMGFSSKKANHIVFTAWGCPRSPWPNKNNPEKCWQKRHAMFYETQFLLWDKTNKNALRYRTYKNRSSEERNNFYRSRKFGHTASNRLQKQQFLCTLRRTGRSAQTHLHDTTSVSAWNFVNDVQTKPRHIVDKTDPVEKKRLPTIWRKVPIQRHGIERHSATYSPKISQLSATCDPP